MLTKLTLLSGLAASLYMTGLIVFVHFVHYPLFEKVHPDAFREYHAEHVRRTTPAVFAPMVVELIASGLLVYKRPEGTPAALAWAGLLAAAVCWLSTAALSVPLHTRLAGGFEAHVHRSLVRTNLVRLLAWGAHSAVMLIMAWRAMK